MRAVRTELALGRTPLPIGDDEKLGGTGAEKSSLATVTTSIELGIRVSAESTSGVGFASSTDGDSTVGD